MRKMVVFLCLLCNVCVLAQENLAKFFPAGKTNAGMLVESYMAPLAEDLGTLVNNGWVTTAATHEKFGFDINVTMNSIFINDQNKYFLPPATLSNFVYDGNTIGSKDLIPTIYGSEGEYPRFHFSGGPENNKVIEGPDGLDPSKTYKLQVQALPTLQAGFGLFKKTDIRLRYTPSFKIDNVKAGTWGVGVMHDIKQHIPGISSMPFSLSIFLGYTRLNGNVDLSGLYSGAGQKGNIGSNGFTGQLLISKSVRFITFYGTVGYNNSKSTFDVKGTYVVDKAYNSSGTVTLSQPFTLTDPYSITYKKSGVRATGGVRFKFGPVTLNGDYTLFNSRGLLTAGLGLSFR